MKNNYENIWNNERVVEIDFIKSELNKINNLKILNVGGIPSNPSQSVDYHEIAKRNNLTYKICDFRGGDYQGDFVTLNIPEKFDIIIFLSSLEHFPQCSEGDMVYRQGEDIKGFKKALNLLNDKGIILLTVPIGKQLWQPYHQNYNPEGILNLTKGSKIIEFYIYKLENNTWKLTEEDTDEILYTDKCYCVGCFKLRKQ